MVRARARKKTPVTPSRKARGMNTTTGVRVEPTSGRTISPIASRVAVRRLQAAHPLGVDGLDHDDGVVDDEADGRRDASQRHQVEGHPGGLDGDEGDEHGDRDDQDGDERRPPVLQEEIEDEDRTGRGRKGWLPRRSGPRRGRGATGRRRTPASGPRAAPFQALRGPSSRRLAMSSVLPSGWLQTLSRTASWPSAVTTLKTGSGPRSTRAKSRTQDRVPAGDRHGEVLDVLERADAAVHHGQVEHAVLFVQAGRRHEIVPVQGLGDLRQGEAGRPQADRIDDDMVFGRPAAHEVHPGDAGDLEEARLELVAGDLPELGEVPLAD